MNLKGIAVAWFREEDWPRWRAIDPNFEADYDRWLRRTEEAIARQPAGQPLQKVFLDPDRFLEWSRANGGKIDGKARAVYAAILLAEEHRSGGSKH